MKSIAINGAQWGDEGKGKNVHPFQRRDIFGEISGEDGREKSIG